MPKSIDYQGLVIGKVTIGSFVRAEKNRRLWEARCECGTTYLIAAGHIPQIKGMGCWDCSRKSNLSHGLALTRLDTIHHGMKQRCYNPNNKGYVWYGGRGITICEEWHDLGAFAKWAMENGYEDHLTIDRIENDKGYSPDNCKWITVQEQQFNKRTNRNFEINGITKSLTKWCEEYNISLNTVSGRLSTGMSITESLTTPIGSIPSNQFGRAVRLRHNPIGPVAQ